jgi:histidine triad (HIT) family protein
MAADTVNCSFCRIVAGDERSSIVYEDDRAVAFLDRRPLFPGHTLVVPRRHIVTLGELPAEELVPLMRVVQAAARAMESALAAQGSLVAVNNRVSQSVPHLHVHVVPRTKGDGLKGFFWPRTSYASDEARDQVAAILREGIAKELEREP